MDTTWTNMRQVVADRVLNRHLRDLEDCDQQVAMGMTPKHHHRLAQRRGSGEPPPKLHAFPAPPSNTKPNAKHHSPAHPPGSSEEPPETPPLPFQPPPEERPPSRDGARIVDMMAETLQSASLMEQQRPSLYLHGAESKPGSGHFKVTHPKPDTTLPQPSKSAHRKGSKGSKGSKSPPLEIGSPSLEKGEMYVKTSKYQMLSIDASVDSLAASLGSGQFPRPITSASKATKARRSSLSSHHELHQPKIPQPRRRSVHVAMPEQEGAPQAHPQRRKSVHVEFYDEIDTGLRKEKGGFTPHHLTLPLHLLHDGSSDDNNDNADGGEGEGGEGEAKEGEKVEKESEEGKGMDESWDDVKKCHYIRGYDPPHMRMPNDSVKFVFGEKKDGVDQPR